MYPTITIVFGHLPWTPGQISFLLNCESANLEDSLYFLYIFFQKLQACAGFILESQLKSKISHSLIHMGFIGLVTWSRVRGLWKNIREAQRVFEGYVWVRTSRALLVPLFISTSELGFTPFLLYINPSLHFCAFLVKFGDLLSLFIFTRLWRILSLLFYCCPTLCMCSLHCSSHRFSGGSHSGFYFAFAIFFFLCCFQKTNMLWLGGGSKG